jgi:quaternary ammonium compound-resistance protein SugE
MQSGWAFGAALIAGYAVWSGQERVSGLRAFLLLGIVGCVLGLKITQ